jgi:hypothetical protein
MKRRKQKNTSVKAVDGAKNGKKTKTCLHQIFSFANNVFLITPSK